MLEQRLIVTGKPYVLWYARTSRSAEALEVEYGEEVEDDKMKLYGEALSNHIISIIGACPIYEETYSVILCTGLKINIDKTIYDAIDNYLSKYLEKEM